MLENQFTKPEFTKQFISSLEDYNKAICNGDEPSAMAKEFMQTIFDSDYDAAFAYSTVLEEMEDSTTAKVLQDIAFNSSCF